MRVDLREPRIERGMPYGEIREDGRQQAAGRRGERGDRQASRRQPAALLQIRLGALDDDHQVLCCAGEFEGLVGEAHAPPVPFEEYGPRLPLQLGDLLRDRGRRVAERRRGGPDRAVHGDGVQRAQPLEIEHAGLPVSLGQS